jgi:hypothetical protein
VGTQGAQAIEVLVDLAPELQLQHAKAAPEVLVGLAQRLFGGGLDADRDRRRQRLVRAAEQIDERQLERAREQIVQRQVDRGASRRRLRQRRAQAAQQGGERAHVGATQPTERRVGQRGPARLGRLARDVRRWGRGAEAHAPRFVGQGDDAELDRVNSLVGDRVGPRERHGHPAERDVDDARLHAPPIRRCSST